MLTFNINSSKEPLNMFTFSKIWCTVVKYVPPDHLRSFPNSSKSSRSQMFFKVVVLNNFVMLKIKHLCWSLFLIDFLGCFPVNIAKFLRTAFLDRIPAVAACVLPPKGSVENVPNDVLLRCIRDVLSE